MRDGIYKRHLINFLFIVSFPMYGIGLYVAAVTTPSAGYLVSSFTYILIILFHAIDILYKREFAIKLNRNYWVLFLYLLSVVGSLAISIQKNLPQSDLNMLIIRSVLILVPVHAFLVVYVYNMHRDDIARLTLTGLSVLLAINLVGYYILGLTNEVHNIEGRINFPFLDGVYSGACLIAIINLMLFYSLRKIWSKPLTASFIILYFSLNLILFFFINSRLVTLVMLLVLLLMIFNVTKTFRGVFTLSIFTLPLLLSGGLIIYQILSLPAFTAIMQRVDLLDVVTFHGRSFLWQNGMDWLLEDQRGLIFGNGYKGHYFLDLFGDIMKLFDLKEAQHMHMHSTTLEIAVSQGLFGLVLFLFACYLGYRYYKKQYQLGRTEGAFLPVMIFMIFISHVDGFVYMDNLGAMLFAFLISRTVVGIKVTQPEVNVPFKENGYHQINSSLS